MVVILCTGASSKLRPPVLILSQHNCIEILSDYIRQFRANLNILRFQKNQMQCGHTAGSPEHIWYFNIHHGNENNFKYTEGMKDSVFSYKSINRPRTKIGTSTGVGILLEDLD